MRSPDAPSDVESGFLMREELETPSSETRRLWLLALLVLLALVLLHLTPLKGWVEDIQAIKSRLDALGAIADAAFILCCILAVAVGVPRLALAGLAGALFGFIEGTLLSLVSATCGSYGAFLLARWGGQAAAERKLRSAGPRLRSLLTTPSVGSIVIARQLPVPGLVVNMALGLLPIRHATFLIGTVVGYVPSTIIVALAGSSLGKDDLKLAILQISLSLAALAVLSALLIWLSRYSGWRGRQDK